MPWQEEWRNQDRPEDNQIPNKYGLLSNLKDNKMVAYFIGVLVASYFALGTIGTQATLLAGLPVLMWLMVGIAALILIGLYISASRERVTEDTAQTDRQPLQREVEDDD
jgi:hypothetical protein